MTTGKLAAFKRLKDDCVCLTQSHFIITSTNRNELNGRGKSQYKLTLQAHCGRETEERAGREPERGEMERNMLESETKKKATEVGEAGSLSNDIILSSPSADIID